MAASSSPLSASKRFVAALFLSAVAHALLTSSLKPGSARGGLTGLSSPRVSQEILARLVPAELEHVPDPVARTTEAMQVQEPVQRAHKTPQRVTRVPTSESDAPSAGPAELPDTTYYAARQLDVYPALVNALELRDSTSTASADVNGYVLLLVLIDATGVVDDVSIVEAQPSGHFDEAARHALKVARFRPAMRSGRAVKSRVLIQLDYGAVAASR
jgi:TonB family protein